VTIPAAPLPMVLAEIALIAGDDAARRVAGAVGGTRVYIPAAPSPDHWLTGLVGHKAALAIADHFTGGFSGGARIDIPLADTGFMAQQQARCDAMILSGKHSERDIARACGYTERGVRKRKARIGALRDSRQGSLFQD
jgi:hypothetical protein